MNRKTLRTGDKRCNEPPRQQKPVAIAALSGENHRPHGQHLFFL